MRVKGQTRPLRILALFLAVALLACLALLTYSAVTYSNPATRDSQFLLTTESDAANFVYSQREVGNLAVKTQAWLAGNASKRDVQVARALLARRLAVVGEGGTTPGADNPTLTQNLAAFDAAFESAPTGILPATEREAWSRAMVPVIAPIEAEGKHLVTEYQRKAANRALAISEQQKSDQRRQTRLLIATILLTAALGATIARLLVLTNRTARERLTADERALSVARTALADAARSSAGQSKVLEAIATGEPLAHTSALIADLAVLDRAGTAARVTCGTLIVTAGDMPTSETPHVAPASWIGSVSDKYDAATTIEIQESSRATLEVFSPEPLSPAATEQVKDCLDLLAIAVERDATEQRLTFQARHDPLTGLPNRLTLLDELDALLMQRDATPLPVGVLFVDLDRFKDVNDSLGHESGDQLLISVVRRLHVAVRAEDLLFRLAGDEFVVLCPRLRTAQGAEELAGRLLRDLAEPIQVGGGPVWVTASIGVAVSGPDASAAELLHEADLAMYRAKADGRNRWHLFDSSLALEATDRLTLSNALKNATDNGELRLLYQPIVGMATGEVFGYEALLRWERPGHGLVPPDSFLDMAEENREIVAIGAWVITEALRTLVRWRAAGLPDTVSMSVNVSVQQLKESEFPTLVLACLERADIPATNLVLEVTEHSLAEGETVAGSLSLLRRAGIRVALDDFGTGYSSLTQLERLGVDIVKVDRMFVRAPDPDSARHEAFLQGVVNLVRALDIAVIVEGVESESERQALLRAGFALGQGFLLGAPAEQPLPGEVQL